MNNDMKGCLFEERPGQRPKFLVVFFFVTLSKFAIELFGFTTCTALPRSWG